ncbi:MAG TPA: GntR family transcriptional regulator [Trebonia sp.]|jgi:DNA-binding FadR family transcriptional regulator|nr:GntR family transcriptional regulator [Trebonia sp.]
MADGRYAVSLIAPLAALGRADEVALRVDQAIQLGLLADGEQLPPEAEFAAQLGVSAMTLREALAVLRQQGLVETRRGRTGGTFVRRPAAPQLGPLRDRLRAMTAGELRDLTDEQSAVSGAAARLAATRASTVSVRRLLALADQLAAAPTTEARIMADSRFHVDVAIASKSQRLTALEVALQARLTELLWLPATAGEEAAARAAERPGLALPPASLDVAAAAEEHAAIAAAIEAENGSRARLLAEEHAESNLRRLTTHRLWLPPQR